MLKENYRPLNVQSYRTWEKYETPNRRINAGKFFLELHNRIFLPAVVETVRVPASLVVLPLPQDRVSDVSAGLNEKSIHSEDPVGGQRGHQLGNQTENLFRWHFIRHWCSQICELKASRSVL